MKPTAILSSCGQYRYHLRRELAVRNEHAPAPATLLFVMLNPSTADATADDPTIRKCIGFARQLGYFAIEVVNLFAYRATDPRDLRNAWTAGTDVIGAENDAHIRFAAGEADRVICAWGAFSGCNLPARARGVMEVLARAGKSPVCLGTTKDGQPRHPLMLAYASKLEAWPRRSA